MSSEIINTDKAFSSPYQNTNMPSFNLKVQQYYWIGEEHGSLSEQLLSPCAMKFDVSLWQALWAERCWTQCPQAIEDRTPQMMWFSMFFYWDSFLHSLPFSKAISSFCYLLHVVRHYSRVLYSPRNVPQLERNRTAIIVILLPQASRMNAIGACRQEIMIMLPVFL